KVFDESSSDSGEREFRALAPHEQRRILVSLIERGRSDEEIGKLLGMSQWQVRNLRYRLGIKKDRGGNVYLEAPDRSGTGRSIGAPASEWMERDRQAENAPFTLILHGTFKGEQVARRLEGLRALFENADPDRAYRVHIQL